MLTLHIIPPRLQKFIVFYIFQLHPPRLPIHLPENPVFMLPKCPIQRAPLRRTLNPPGSSLVNVDMSNGLIVDVLRDGQGDCSERDRFAEKPAYTLLSKGERRPFSKKSGGSGGNIDDGGGTRIRIGSGSSDKVLFCAEGSAKAIDVEGGIHEPSPICPRDLSVFFQEERP